MPLHGRSTRAYNEANDPIILKRVSNRARSEMGHGLFRNPYFRLLFYVFFHKEYENIILFVSVLN